MTGTRSTWHANACAPNSNVDCMTPVTSSCSGQTLAGCASSPERRSERAADLKSMRVLASEGDPDSIALMKAYYTPVVLEPDKIYLSLRNKMIDAAPIPPVPGECHADRTACAVHGRPALGADHRRHDRAPQRLGGDSTRRRGPGYGSRRNGRAWTCAASRAQRIEQAIKAMQEKQGLKVIHLSADAERSGARKSPHVSGDPRPAGAGGDVRRGREDPRPGRAGRADEYADTWTAMGRRWQVVSDWARYKAFEHAARLARFWRLSNPGCSRRRSLPWWGSGWPAPLHSSPAPTSWSGT